jgi:hypothetical protein
MAKAQGLCEVATGVGTKVPILAIGVAGSGREDGGAVSVEIRMGPCNAVYISG